MKQQLDDAQRPLAGERILIVDDEILIALDLESIFVGAGANVVGPCTTLREAMQAAANEALSAAVLDIRLGQQTTENVAQLLTERHIPFVFYTGQPAAATLAVRERAPTIIKPARERQLVEAVVHLLEE